MPRILILNPNSSTSTSQFMLAQAQDFLTALLGSTAYLQAYTNSRAPAMLQMPDDLLAAEQALNSPSVLHFCAQFDGIILAAFGEPGLTTLSQKISIPVVGLGSAAVRYASTTYGSYGIATSTHELQDALQQQVQGYPEAHAFTGLRLTSSPANLLAQNPLQQRQELGQAAWESIHLDQAKAVIIGGGPLSSACEWIASHYQINVVNPIYAACHALSVILKRTSKPN